MFSTKEYEWSSVTITVGGKMLTAVQSIEYTVEQEKEVIYGKGNEPTSIQTGNKSYSGTLGVLQSELETLSANGGADGVLGLEVDITVSYGNALKGDVVRTDVLQGVQFTSEPKSMSQGDKNMGAQSLPFIFLRKKQIV